MQGSFLKGVVIVVSLFIVATAFALGVGSRPMPANQSYDEHVNQAGALCKEKRFGEALAEAQEAIRQDAGRYQAHAVKAIILCDMGKYAEAKAAVNDALQVAPENKLAEVQNIVKHIANAQGVRARLRSQPPASRRPPLPGTPTNQGRYPRVMMIM